MNTKTEEIINTEERRTTLYPYHRQDNKWIVANEQDHIIPLGWVFESEDELMEYVKSFWPAKSIFGGREVEDEIGKGWSVMTHLGG